MKMVRCKLRKPKFVFLKSGSEKNMTKTVNSISLARAGCYGGARTIISLLSRKYFFYNFYNYKVIIYK